MSSQLKTLPSCFIAFSSSTTQQPERREWNEKERGKRACIELHSMVESHSSNHPMVFLFLDFDFHPPNHNNLNRIFSISPPFHSSLSICISWRKEWRRERRARVWEIVKEAFYTLSLVWLKPSLTHYLHHIFETHTIRKGKSEISPSLGFLFIVLELYV